jgi:cell wall-associated NlpC family hydrolase
MRLGAGGLGAWLLAAAAAQGRAQDGYVSPYKLAFTLPATDRNIGFDAAPWNDPRLQSSVPFAQWYDPATRRRWTSWGPPSRQYPAAPWVGRDRTWLQERVLTVAGSLIGLPYQHHHIPAFDPPEGWPWKKVAYGRNSRGLDCSNFTAFVYNYALGLKFTGGIGPQAAVTETAGPGGQGVLAPRRLAPAGYGALVAALEPADLLYIAKKTGEPGHVVLWLGRLGAGPDATPLILDCTGSSSIDANGVKVPNGVHIRPFRPESWYARRALHALRPLDGLLRLRDGVAPPPVDGGADDEDADL